MNPPEFDPQNVPTEIDLREDGVLWMINTTIFHPRGLRLGVDPDGTLWLFGDGSEPTLFTEELAERGFANFEQMLLRHRDEIEDQRQKA